MYFNIPEFFDEIKANQPVVLLHKLKIPEEWSEKYDASSSSSSAFHQKSSDDSSTPLFVRELQETDNNPPVVSPSTFREQKTTAISLFHRYFSRKSDKREKLSHKIKKRTLGSKKIKTNDIKKDCLKKRSEVRVRITLKNKSSKELTHDTPVRTKRASASSRVRTSSPLDSSDPKASVHESTPGVNITIREMPGKPLIISPRTSIKRAKNSRRLSTDSSYGSQKKSYKKKRRFGPPEVDWTSSYPSPFMTAPLIPEENREFNPDDDDDVEHFGFPFCAEKIPTIHDIWDLLLEKGDPDMYRGRLLKTKHCSSMTKLYLWASGVVFERPKPVDRPIDMDGDLEDQDSHHDVEDEDVEDEDVEDNDAADDSETGDSKDEEEGDDQVEGETCKTPDLIQWPEVPEDSPQVSSGYGTDDDHHLDSFFEESTSLKSIVEGSEEETNLQILNPFTHDKLPCLKPIVYKSGDCFQECFMPVFLGPFPLMINLRQVINSLMEALNHVERKIYCSICDFSSEDLVGYELLDHQTDSHDLKDPRNVSFRLKRRSSVPENF